MDPMDSIGLLSNPSPLKESQSTVVWLTHGTTRLPQIPSVSLCFQWIQWTPSDYFPTLLLSKSLKVPLFDWLMARIDFRRLHRNRCVSNGPKDSIGLLSNPSPLRESQSIFRLDSIGLPDIAVSFGVVFRRDVVEVKVQWIQQNANDKIKLTCYCRAAEEINFFFTFGNN